MTAHFLLSFSAYVLTVMGKAQGRCTILLAQQPPCRTLTRLWMREEAVYKLVGRMPRDRLCLSEDALTRETLCISFEERTMEGEYVLTIALNEDEASVKRTEP